MGQVKKKRIKVQTTAMAAHSALECIGQGTNDMLTKVVLYRKKTSNNVNQNSGCSDLRDEKGVCLFGRIRMTTTRTDAVLVDHGPWSLCSQFKSWARAARAGQVLKRTQNRRIVVRVLSSAKPGQHLGYLSLATLFGHPVNQPGYWRRNRIDMATRKSNSDTF